jgi:hypothetical protein
MAATETFGGVYYGTKDVRAAAGKQVLVNLKQGCGADSEECASAPGAGGVIPGTGMKMLTEIGQGEGKKGQMNLATVPEREIDQVHELWAEPGLLQFLILAMSLDAGEFEHFYGLTRSTSVLGA